jgi:RNA polymerase sigma factor (sigma-70 family)
VKTDAQLIEEARTDPAAFGELYERHVRALHSWFRARAGSAAAMDLTAETFAQAACSLRRFRDESRGSAAPWLYGIARNLLRRFHERNRVETSARKRLGIELTSYEAGFEAVEERAAAEAAAGDLRTAVEALPPEQREALELRVVEQRPYGEVARSLGTSETAARLRVMRALGSLSRMLKGALP